MNATSLRTLIFALSANLLLVACGETQLPVATGKGSIRGIHAIVGFSDVDFLIEERRIGTADFKNATGASYDDLSYTFNFELPQVGEQPLRIASRTLDVDRDTEYSIVLTGDTGAQEATLWQRAEREWTGSETVFDVMVGHANGTLGSVDVYLDAAGSVPVAGNALASLNFRQQSEPRDLEAGEYQLTLTPAGNPATILYRSAPTNFPAAASYLLTVFEADPGITGPVSIRVFTSSNVSTELPDERFPATAQFVNASIASGAVDIAIDGDYTNLAVSNLAFGAVSQDVEVPSSGNYQYAPTGTTMALLDEDRTVVLGSTNLMILAGEANDLVTLQAAGLRRGFSTVGRLRITNTATEFDAVDVYILEAGASVDDNFPSLFNFPYGFNQVLDRAADDYEITLTETTTKNVIAGPEPLPVDVFDVTEIVILDAPDTGALGILTFSN